MNAFSVTLGNVLLALAYLLAGFVLCRVKLFKPDHISSVSAILLYFCGPCMFIGALMKQDVTADLNRNMLLFFLFTLAAQVLFMLLVWLLQGKRRKTFSGRMMSIASVVGNAGFFGLPIIQSVFPDVPEAAAYSCIFCLSMNILAWTMGIFVLTIDRKYISLKAAFLNPTVVSVAFALVLYFLRAKNWMPELVLSGVQSAGAISTPLCMILLGVRLSTMKASSLFTQPVPWFVVLCKLVVFPLFSYALVLFLPLPAIFKAAVLILSATPCASVILNLSEIHKSGQELAADCTLLSTILSVVTSPLLSLLL